MTEERSAVVTPPRPAEPLPLLAVAHEPGASATLPDLRRAARGLCDVVVLVPDRVARMDARFVELAERLFDVRVVAAGEFTSVLAACGARGVTTFHDNLVEEVDRAARALGLAGPPPTNVWDKLQQRRLLLEAGLTRVHAVGVDAPQTFEAAVLEVGLPGVLKPRRGYASSGVAMISSRADAELQLDRRHDWHDLLYESRIVTAAGAERPPAFHSMETVTVSGRSIHYVLDKQAPRYERAWDADGTDLIFEEVDVFPSALPDHTQRILADHVEAVLAALGVTCRVTHTEVLLTEDGPEVIEVNGRTAGLLTHLTGAVAGPDLIADSMSVALSNPVAAVVPQEVGMLVTPAMPSASGVVRSEVSRRDLAGLAGVAKVMQVAHHGTAIADDPYMVQLVLTAPGHAVLQQHKAALDEELARLFEPDVRSAHG